MLVTWHPLQPVDGTMDDTAVRDALTSALPDADETLREYAITCAQGVVADGGSDTLAELEDALLPLLGDAGMSDPEIVDLCRRLAQLGKPDAGQAEAGDSCDDVLLDLRGIILAYAGRSLLKPCTLMLRRGRRYGLVGQNGVGKTTLLTRLAAGDIHNFPAALRRVYVQHEVLAASDKSVSAFMQEHNPDATEEDVEAALARVGFTLQLRQAQLSALSGGWRMRLALARSTLQNVDLLLLDEPTNHLDSAAVTWLQHYLSAELPGVTAVIVSHDAVFLEAVCTDVMYFADQSLAFFPGMAAFRAAMPHVVLPSKALAAAAQMAQDDGPAAAGGSGPVSGDAAATDEATLAAELAAASAAVAAGKIKPFAFPDPGPMDGVKSRNKVILRATDVVFTHPGAAHATLKHVSARLCLASRVAVTGRNGAGKSTLMKLLVGDIALPPRCGEIWRHHSLRVAYVAQHALHHLEEAQGQTPMQYIQTRFQHGRDGEDKRKSTIALTEEEQALSAARGGVEAIQGRAVRGGELMYEVKKAGRKEKDNSWEPLSFLQAMPPYVMKLVRDYDEQMKAQQGGMEVRALSAAAIKDHLAAYGIGEELALSKIKGFSGGQKSRLVIACAMWNKPHLLCLDEPTNFLDRESIAALACALRTFPGAALVVSHSAAFVQALCTEEWHVEGGAVTVVKERRAIED